MALASSTGGWTAPKADIVVQAGPGTFPAAAGALRLETSDIEDETQPWTRVVERLRGRLGNVAGADAIAWNGGANYSGETRHGRPHGAGIMRFAAASYRGE